MEKTKNNYGKFLLLWAGELISSIGGGLTSFGLGLYIFQKTGSAADMAMLTLLGFLPALVLRTFIENFTIERIRSAWYILVVSIVMAFIFIFLAIIIAFLNKPYIFFRIFIVIHQYILIQRLHSGE